MGDTGGIDLPDGLDLLTGNSTIPIDLVACETANIAVSAVAAFGALVLFGGFQFVSKENKSEILNLPIWVFLVFICNHLYIIYLRDIVNGLGTYIASIVKFIPILIGLILYLAASSRQNMLATLVSASIAAYFVTELDTTWTAVSVGVSVLFTLLVLHIPSIKLYAVRIVMSVICAVIFLVLLAAFWTPDDKACGHSRNLLALCYQDCPVITTKFEFFWPVPVVGGAALIISQLLAHCYKMDKRDRERNKATAAAAAAAINGSGTEEKIQLANGKQEEGIGMERLWQPVGTKITKLKINDINNNSVRFQQVPRRFVYENEDEGDE